MEPTRIGRKTSFKMNAYYNLEYFHERDHLSAPTAHAIKIFAKKYKIKRILDVGCGTGRLIQFLNANGFEAQGCDISKTAVDFANRINNKKIARIASAEKLPFAPNSFDLLISISTIEHLKKNQINKFIKEARRVLVSEGHLFLITPNFATPIRIVQKNKWFGYNDKTHVNFFTPMSLTRLLSKYGFCDFKFLFKTNYHVSYDWEFPVIFRKFPKPLKNIVIFLFFSSPLTFIRNSFWLLSKNTK